MNRRLVGSFMLGFALSLFMDPLLKDWGVWKVTLGAILVVLGNVFLMKEEAQKKSESAKKHTDNN